VKDSFLFLILGFRDFEISYELSIKTNLKIPKSLNPQITSIFLPDGETRNH
jgi:hypothetical protein